MYLKRIVIVILFTCSAAYLTGLWFDSMYKKRWNVLWFEKTEELLKNDSSYDIIFLGNSRVHFGINPYYVDSVTKLKSYNFGNGGADATDIMLTSNLYLQNNKAPKLVIISVDPGILMGNKILQTRYHYLFYLNNDTISKYMHQAGFSTVLIKIFPFIKYSFFDEYNRTSIFVTGKPYPVFEHNIYKGFLNIHQVTNSQLPSPYTRDTVSRKISDSAIMYFKNTLTLLQQKGSDVLIVWPPLRSSAKKFKADFVKTCDSILSTIAKEYRIKQFHFDYDTTYKNEYFVDEIHLNEPGSRIFSKQLGDSINSLK